MLLASTIDFSPKISHLHSKIKCFADIVSTIGFCKRLTLFLFPYHRLLVSFSPFVNSFLCLLVYCISFYLSFVPYSYSLFSYFLSFFLICLSFSSVFLHMIRFSLVFFFCYISVTFLSPLVFAHKHFLHIFKDFSYEFAFSYLFEQICFELFTNKFLGCVKD